MLWLLDSPFLLVSLLAEILVVDALTQRWELLNSGSKVVFYQGNMLKGSGMSTRLLRGLEEHLLA